jgi:hypothetical protein
MLDHLKYLCPHPVVSITTDMHAQPCMHADRWTDPGAHAHSLCSAANAAPTVAVLYAEVQQAPLTDLVDSEDGRSPHTLPLLGPQQDDASSAVRGPPPYKVHGSSLTYLLVACAFLICSALRCLLHAGVEDVVPCRQ